MAKILVGDEITCPSIVEEVAWKEEGDSMYGIEL